MYEDEFMQLVPPTYTTLSVAQIYFGVGIESYIELGNPIHPNETLPAVVKLKLFFSLWNGFGSD